MDFYVIKYSAFYCVHFGKFLGNTEMFFLTGRTYIMFIYIRNCCAWIYRIAFMFIQQIMFFEKWVIIKGVTVV